MQTSAAWKHWRWVSLCLCLLLAACTCASAPATVTPTAGRLTQATPITLYQGHTGPVYTVAWSPDGTRIASGGNDSTVQVWNVRTGRRLLLYTGHVGTVYTVAWSPDAFRLGTGVWAKQEASTISNEPGFYVLLFSWIEGVLPTRCATRLWKNSPPIWWVEVTQS